LLPDWSQASGFCAGGNKAFPNIPAASIFRFGEFTVGEVKQFLPEKIR
jgi:hypothetical protein